MAIAYLQEFEIKNADSRTTNYDAVVAALDLKGDAPDGLLIHTAGFDHDAGVFRIFDVWETRAHAETFINERLTPSIEPMAAAAMQDPESDFTPPNREAWYELHDSMTG
jgi:hypothetical protein